MTDFLGTAGDDLIFGTQSNDTIDGKRGDDTLFGEAFTDTLYGGKGWDTLIGGTGADLLYGGNGRDVLEGGATGDIMTGGNGADTFIVSNDMSFDFITDFKSGKDKIIVDAVPTPSTALYSYEYDAATSSLYIFRDGDAHFDAGNKVVQFRTGTEFQMSDLIA